jgi:acyl-coenzyme A synthetase/AMP-(fatty) acid ligase
VLGDGNEATEAELRDFCRERLSGFKVPKAIKFVTELPRNAQGKLLRRELGGT